MKKINFSAGPAALPEEVLNQAAKAMINFENSGLSIAEISHRSKEFIAVLSQAKELVKELLNVPEGYSVLFLQGGASLQFYMTALNLLPDDKFAEFLDSGTWANKAVKEAEKVGEVRVAASSKADNYTYIPKNYTVDPKAEYFHCTSNNTIFGTQIKSFPDTEVPIVCDMSSDIFSRPVDVSKFGLIYAGAQKNIGPSGTTLVIVRNSLLGKTGRNLPSMLDYELQIKNDSLYNTPCTIAVYMALLNLQTIKKRGGLVEVQKYNRDKAEILYNEIDRNSLFSGTCRQEDRSLMNATFVLNEPEKHEAAFAELCDRYGISGLKGHRSVGGYRASIYNAVTKEGVERLVDIMQRLEQNAKK